MTFTYNALDSNGKKISGKLEAKDSHEARKKLKDQKILYTDLEELSPPFWERFSFDNGKTIAGTLLATLSRDLSMYLKAGVPLVKAIHLAKLQYGKNPKVLLFLTQLGDFLDQGKSFYQALESQSVFVLPEFYKQSIKISENGGMLQDVLVKIADFLKEQEGISKQIKHAMTYPMFIVTVAVGMLAFMLTVVVPKITAIFSSLHQELPNVTKNVIALSHFVSTYWMAIVIVTGIFILAFRWMYREQSVFHREVDRTLLKIPLLGRLIERYELARFSFMAAVLMRSGIPFPQTLRLCAKTLNNMVIQELFTHAAARVVEGERLSQALTREGSTLDRSFIEALALGEETSEIAQMLQNLSTLYFEENKETTTKLMSLIEPTLMLIIGGAVGFIILAIMMPIFSMNLNG